MTFNKPNSCTKPFSVIPYGAAVIQVRQAEQSQQKLQVGLFSTNCCLPDPVVGYGTHGAIVQYKAVTKLLKFSSKAFFLSNAVIFLMLKKPYMLPL